MALKGVQEAKQEQARRKASGGGGNRLWLKIADGETVQIRPLEQDDNFTSCYVHKVEKEIKGKKITVDVVCLDQSGRGENHCPGCEERAKIADKKNDPRFRRSYKFYLNVIWRDGPIYEKEEAEGSDGKKYERFKKDKNGNWIETGRGDVVAIWSGGINAATDLDEANTDYKGITTRDFLVKREGSGLDTTYKIKPLRDENGKEADPNPMTDEDKALAEGKFSFESLITAPSANDFFGERSNSDDGSPSEDPANNVSPFRRRNR